MIFHSSLEIGGADAVFFNALGGALVLALVPSCIRFLRFPRLSEVGCDVVLRQQEGLFILTLCITNKSATCLFCGSSAAKFCFRHGCPEASTRIQSPRYHPGTLIMKDAPTAGTWHSCACCRPGTASKEQATQKTV